MRPGYDSGRVELVACDPLRCLEWHYSWPDAPKSNSRRLRIEFEPAAGGTQLRMSTQWIREPGRKPGWHRPLRWLLRPLHRYALWMQLTQLGASISRAFR